MPARHPSAHTRFQQPPERTGIILKTFRAVHLGELVADEVGRGHPAGQRLADRLAGHVVEEQVTCAIDEGLNENAYIVPGLGDAGDRIFGTL